MKAEARATAACSERDEARAEAANAQADLSSQEALIAHLKLAIEKLRRAIYGSRSERQVRFVCENAREGAVVARHLAGFAGILQVDGYAAYTQLAKAKIRLQ